MSNEFPLNTYECGACKVWSHFPPSFDSFSEPSRCAYCGAIDLIWRSDTMYKLIEIDEGESDGSA